MIAEAFLICAMALPAANFPRVRMTSEYTHVEEVRRLKEFIWKRAPGAEIQFIPIEEGWNNDHLIKQGWERLPWTWRNNEIWIRRRPMDQGGQDTKGRRRVEESA